MVTPRRRPPPKTIPRETVREVAAQLRDTLAAVERGELVGEPGLVARLEGAALALEALAEARHPTWTRRINASNRHYCEPSGR